MSQCSGFSGVETCPLSRIFKVAFLLVLFNSAFPESTFALNPRIALTQYIHKAWRLDQGLPQISVNAITQTQEDYIWVGTDDGLARFDGMHFTIFNRSNVPELGSNSFQALLTSKDGTLWAATSAGLVQYKGGTFKTYTLKDGLPHSYISSLALDAFFRFRMVFPTEKIFRDECKRVYWIHDFQERYFPELFTKEELQGRENYHLGLIKKNANLVLSSYDSKNDFGIRSS